MFQKLLLTFALRSLKPPLQSSAGVKYGTRRVLPERCQHLAGLGECGMCGYEGPGVSQEDQTYVVDANEQTGRYERIPNPDLLARIKADQMERMKRIAQGVEPPKQEQEQGLDRDDDSPW